MAAAPFKPGTRTRAESRLTSKAAQQKKSFNCQPHNVDIYTYMVHLHILNSRVRHYSGFEAAAAAVAKN